MILEYAKKAILLIIVLVVLLGGYSGFVYFQSQSVTITNPTNTPIVVSIDQDPSISISAFSVAKMSISKGEHTLFMDQKEIGKFVKKNFEKDSILNPTMSDFIIEYAVFTVAQTPTTQIRDISFEIDGESYTGPFVVVKGLYIPNQEFWNSFLFFIEQKEGYEWDYGLEKPMPTSISTKRGKDIVKKKIYTIEAFKEMYKKEYQ